MKHINNVLLGLYAMVVRVWQCGAETAAASFNILFILADDLGFNELGYQNESRGLLTPHIDELAQSGTRLRNYYVGPICSPTRSALMTGRYMTRLGTHANVIYWDTPWGVSLNETFVSDHLQTAGYATAMFGKWHLGMFDERYTPIQRGFDTHAGYYQGCESAYTHVSGCCKPGSATHDQNFVCKAPPLGKDYRGYDWFLDGKPNTAVNHTNSAWLIRDHAVHFLQQQRNGASNRPFFLYLPFQNIHNPYTCDASFRALYEHNAKLSEDEKTLFGYISELDHAVGDIVSELKASGRYNNTIIIFSSDNGAPPAGDDVDHPHGHNPPYIARNYPYRGYKSQVWEGGTRVPGFVHSPLLPVEVQGTDNHKLYHVTDWLPTIVGLANYSDSFVDGYSLDGHNIWPSLTKPTQPSPRTEMLYNINPLPDGQAGAPKAALRVDDLKLMTWGYNVSGIAGATSTGPVLCPADSTQCDPAFKTGPVLYNLTADPTEATNIAAEHPQEVAALLKRLHELASEMVPPMQWTAPFQGPGYCCRDCPLHPGGTGPGKPWLPWMTKAPCP